jgi:tRNA A-37 threonylcarbamoyl transferase component Bud32
VSELRWLSGSAELQRVVEAALQGDSAASLLRENPRRRLLRVATSDGVPLLVKHFRTGSHHRRREALKARIGRSPAMREARHLRAAGEAGVPVPDLLGEASLPGGDRLLVMPFLEGEAGVAGLARSQAQRTRQLVALGRAVRALHEAGTVHGDLHAGNVLFGPESAVLLDLQHARRSTLDEDRLRDLGELDYSLWQVASLADRLRVRIAALGPSAEGTERAERLRAVGEHARRKAAQHGRSRTRRLLRAGRLTDTTRREGARGLRWKEFPEPAVAEALDAHARALAEAGDAVLKDDGRSRITRVRAGGRHVLVKEVLPRGPLRILSDGFRGSPAHRGWRGGHGLRARGLAAALPLAYLDERRLGLPIASWLVLEDLSPARDLLELPADVRAEALRALGPWLTRLHLRGVDHGDLKATHLFARADRPGADPALIDLEGIRFPRALSEGRRLQALAELNASLPDEWPATGRLRVFARYTLFEPFVAAGGTALPTLIRMSLARRHRWQGHDCQHARSGPNPGAS